MKELSKIYDPKTVEPEIYDLWMRGDFFKGRADSGKTPFTIVIPPPNVTSKLHIGHAYDNALQDILIRWKRMSGYAALWVPGCDHAGIATQIKVEEMLRSERGVTKHDLGRDAFLAEVWAWKEKYGGEIINQLKRLGSSCDWSRERFTMDEGCSRAVREVFTRLYEKGLIYKGKRIVNWCPNCVTALSDVEVEHEDRESAFYKIRYPLKDGSGYLTVATTRPETMLGDTAVAVNPEDPRYSGKIGQLLILPLVGREIPIIGDDHADMSLGTGCVKITPAHDPNDFEVGKRHNLPVIRILDDYGKVNDGGKYDGMDRYDARKAIIADLDAQGLLEGIENRSNAVGTCYRCGAAVEPIASEQWFVKMKPLAEPAIKAVEDGDIKFVPERFSKNYLNWMRNIQDWCVSRQLWWGHQIPAWTCSECGHITVSRDDPTECEHCRGSSITRDGDVLDTWFSSALWPFSTLGWPDQTPDLDFFYPTSVLVTGYDIIPFWVARMIFSGLEQTGKKPFDTVLIHGLVRDELGRKMSKSLGNGIDPLEMIDDYGADALRMNLVMGVDAGSDTRFTQKKIESFRNFANKLWNASRFTLMQLETQDSRRTEDFSAPQPRTSADRWILSKLNRLTREVGANLNNFNLGVAVGKIYDFIWDDFCDWYIELSKISLTPSVLCFTLGETLKLLHPFMPYITEAIWQSLPMGGEGSRALMIQPYPQYDDNLNYAEAEIESLIRGIRAIRALRADKNVPTGKRTKIYVSADNPERFPETALQRLVFASDVEYDTPPNVSDMVTAITEDAKFFIPLNELVDSAAEQARIAKELEKVSADRDRLMAKLANPEFTSKAPERVVAAERERLAKAEALIKQLTADNRVYFTE
ncbi:MAG: valine--tRNA ligase [Oscillospiraceae bacterium]|jgi:valyl-tRNA synthetase|nr:valine--tRNA ligase [Oscillospiraceae bacterium]